MYSNAIFIAVVDGPFVYFIPSAALNADARSSCGPLATAAVVTSPRFTVMSTTTVPWMPRSSASCGYSGYTVLICLRGASDAACDRAACGCAAAVQLIAVAEPSAIRKRDTRSGSGSFDVAADTSDEARNGIAAMAISPVRDGDGDERQRGDGETHARHMSLLKDRVDPRAQLARTEHPRAGLRKVRREIVTGHIDETAHVLVTIAEQLDDACRRRPALAPRGCGRGTATSTDETTRLRRRALRRTRP